MRYRDDVRVVIEAAEECGVELSLEDAAWACRPYKPDCASPCGDDGTFQRGVAAVLSLARPGRWDRW